MIGRCLGLAVAALLLVLLFAGVAPTARAQVQQGATLTVLRGQVAVVRSDGSAVQPAPSGTLVNIGDEIRTLGNTGALITFFEGSEIELSENTILAVNEISRQGDRIDISLRQVLGASVSRVTTLTGTGSTYRIEAGGAVAVVRGTEFALIGPISTGAGDVVILVCLSDCGPASSFAGCPLQPFLGYGVVVGNGKVESGCMPFAVAHSANMLSAAFEAVTTIEQQAQGDTRGVPAGQVAPGQRQESASRSQQQDRKENEDEKCPSGQIETPTGHWEALALGVGTAPGQLGALLSPGLVLALGRSRRGLRAAARPCRRGLRTAFVGLTVMLTLLGQTDTVHALTATTALRAAPPAAEQIPARVISAPPTPQELAQAMGIPSASILAASFNGSDITGLGISTALGSFPTEGTTFAILSTGQAANASRANLETNLTATLGGLNNSQGNDLVQLALTLAVPVTANCARVDFQFLSEEFPEFVGFSFNDVFLAERGASTFTISGNTVTAPNNFAFDSNGGLISVNTVFGVTAAAAAGTTYDGATSVLRAATPVTPGTTVNIIFSVTDLGDSNLDSAVFLDRFTFSNDPACTAGASMVPTGSIPPSTTAPASTLPAAAPPAAALPPAAPSPVARPCG